MRAASVLLAFLLIQLLVASCSTQSGAWEDAQRSDTVSAYRKFVDAYPASQHAAAAERRIENLEFEGAIKRRDARQITGLLERYPRSEHAASASNVLAELEFNSVARTNSISSYRSFIKKYPSSPLVSLAQSKLDALTADADRRKAADDARRKDLKARKVVEPPDPNCIIFDGSTWRCAGFEVLGEAKRPAYCRLHIRHEFGVVFPSKAVNISAVVLNRPSPDKCAVEIDGSKRLIDCPSDETVASCKP